MNNIDTSSKVAFLSRIFGGQSFRRGDNVAVSCPKCNNKTKKKLSIHILTDVCHCWVCGLSGKLINILLQYKHHHVREYIAHFVAKNTQLLLDDDQPKVAMLPGSVTLLASQLSSTDFFVRRALAYLQSRGMTERDLWYYRFCVSDDQSLYGRVIFPSFNQLGELNYYVARSISDDTYKKYVNCDMPKKLIVFNELNIDWTSELTIVEGPFDLTKCDDNTTCLLGSSLSEDSLLFARIYANRTPITLALDNDMKQKSWQKIARMLSAYGINVKIIDTSEYVDVGSMTKKQFLAAKDVAVEWNRKTALSMKIDALIP